MQIKKIKSINKNHLLILLGIFFISSSLFILLFNHFNNIKTKQQEEEKIEEFLITENTAPINNQEVVEIETNTITTPYKNQYRSVLEIPKIDLRKGLYEISSNYNSVKYNIEIIKNSTFPDVVNGNFILASHNGTGTLAYFKNLSQLNVNDSIYVYYDNYKYEYKLNEIYETPKDGKIEISRDHNKTTITLITCKKNSKDKQVVYIGYLDNKVSY